MANHEVTRDQTKVPFVDAKVADHEVIFNLRVSNIVFIPAWCGNSNIAKSSHYFSMKKEVSKANPSNYGHGKTDNDIYVGTYRLTLYRYKNETA